MNTGAAKAKKDMFSFLELATRFGDELPFRIYPLGPDSRLLRERNEELGRPVMVSDPIQYPEMPAVYKQHTWLVYLGDRGLRSVGWPLSIAEAQASGVGVIMQDLRPDLKEYVGPAGFICDSIDDAAKILTQPYPEEMREAGFEHAKKSDIAVHKTILTDLWAPVIAGSVAKAS
jgi:glycosyltransferase involved in cell wall biosynthesis